MLASLLSRLSAPRSPPGQSSADASLCSLEAHASRSSAALARFTSSLSQRTDLSPRAVQPQLERADPREGRSSAQEEASFGPSSLLLTAQQQHQASLQAAREMAAFEAMRSTQQEIFSAARARAGTEGLSEFVCMTISASSPEEGGTGEKSASQTIRTAIDDARRKLSEELARHTRQAYAAGASLSAGPYAVRAAARAVRAAMSCARASVDSSVECGALATASICQLAKTLPEDGSGEFNPNLVLSQAGSLVRELEEALDALCSDQVRGVEAAVQQLPPPSTSSSGPIGEEEARELEEARAAVQAEGKELCELAREMADRAISKADSAAHCLLVRTQYLAALRRWPLDMAASTDSQAVCKEV